ncbi:MAG: DinB family protein [Bryobacteraceae bacterium]
MPVESAKELFRHSLATLAYRGGKAFRGAPDAFSDFRVAPGSRTAGEILAHIGDVLDWALIMAKDKHVWHESAPQAWNQDVERFFKVLAELDAFIASDAPLQAPLDKLFQGPVADALTHVGQIAMMRRLAEAPLKGENFFRADILIGRISPA